MTCIRVTDRQLDLLKETEGRYGRELRGSFHWQAARRLEAAGLVTIDGDPGQELPAMMWATDDGKSLLEDMDELEREGWEE